MERKIVVLDTHTAIWWTQSPELLSAPATRAIAGAGTILVPAIVFWETALLVRKGRLRLKRDQAVGEWAQAVLDIPRVRCAELSMPLALAADRLDMHADPADRFIAATALAAGAPLVSKDKLLRRLRWLKTVW